MKIFPLLFILVLAPGLAVELRKEVTGPQIVDFGESLAVRLTISTREPIFLESIEDPVPPGFRAEIDQPNCKADSIVRCTFNLNTSGSLSISYKLVGATASRRTFIDRATVSYVAGGTAERKVSNEIPGVYSVGLAYLNLSISKLEVDGLAAAAAKLLPGSSLRVLASVENGGAIGTADVSVSAIPDDASLKSLTPLEINRTKLEAGETLGTLFTFAAPVNFTEGTSKILVAARWRDQNGTFRETTKTLEVSYTKPNLIVKRTISVEWKQREKQLLPIVKIIFSLENRGSATAIANLSQGRPQLRNLETGEATVGTTILSLQTIVEPNQQKQWETSGVATAGTLEIPAGTAVYTDSRGNPYNSSAFAGETIQVSPTIWSIIFSLIAPYYPTVQIVAAVVLLGLLAFGRNLLANKLLLAFGTLLAVLSLLVLISTALVLI